MHIKFKYKIHFKHYFKYKIQNCILCLKYKYKIQRVECCNKKESVPVSVIRLYGCERVFFGLVGLHREFP